VPLTVDFAGGAIEYFHLAAPTFSFGIDGLLANISIIAVSMPPCRCHWSPNDPESQDTAQTSKASNNRPLLLLRVSRSRRLCHDLTFSLTALGFSINCLA